MIRNRPQRAFHQVLVSRHLGGAELVAMNVTRYLHAHGTSTIAWVPGAGAAWEALKEQALPVRRFGLEEMQRGAVRQAMHCSKMALDLRASGASLVHVHNPTLFGILWPALRLAGVPTLAHVHIEPEPHEIGWAFKRLPDIIVTCASFLVETVRTMLGPRAEKATIVSLPNAVDTSQFAPGDRAAAKRAIAAPLDRPLLLMLANIAPHKGQQTAIEAVARLKARGVHVECWLAGEERGGSGTFSARLRTLIENLGVGDRVRLLGFRQDGAELLRAADMLLLPSTREGLPLTILEAQAAAVPVLAAPTAGIPEVVTEGKTGFLIAADDPAGYSAKIAFLLANPSYAAAIADRARQQVVTNFGWDTYCKRTIDIYDQLLRRRSAVLGRAESR